MCVYLCALCCSTLLQRGADFNVEDSEGARPDELARHCCANDCCDVIVNRRQQHMSQLCMLVKQVIIVIVTVIVVIIIIVCLSVCLFV